MKLLKNSGNERVIDSIRAWLEPESTVDFMSPAFSLYAFAEMRDLLLKAGPCRILLGDEAALSDALFGGASDIAARGKLQGRWLARTAGDWIRKHADIRHAAAAPPQSLIVVDKDLSLIHI